MAEGEGGQNIYPYNGTHNNVVRQETTSTSNTTAATDAVSSAVATNTNIRERIIVAADVQESTEACDLIPNNNRHEENSSQYECVKCNIVYSRKLDYVLHVRNCHTNSEKFKCDLCIKICSNYPALMRHKIMAHTATRYT